MPYKQPGWQKPQSQQYLGRGVLHQRLASQVGDPAMAQRILMRRGHMRPDGSYTGAGQARNVMTAETRAQDRAFKRDLKLGKQKQSPSAYIYDSRTNTTT